MLAAALRRCRGCGGELPLAPIPRYEVCEACGWEPSPVEHPPKSGIWTQDSPQRRFLAETAFECGYGGQAGGGKSEGLVAQPLRFIHLPSFRALILRRTFPELERSLIPRAIEMYGKVEPGGYTSSPTPRYRFRSGAVVEFGHLQHESDLDKYQSAEYQLIEFDEGAHFIERMVTYMMSRARSSKGIPSRVRVTFNPPRDLAGAWVVRRFGPWIDHSADYHGVRAVSGQRLYYVNSRTVGERYVPKGTLDEEGNPAQGRVFIRSTIADNPYLDRNDPGYRSRLLALDPVTRAQLLDGDFSRIDRPGAIWQRALIDAGRRTSHPVLHRIGVGLDPSGSHRRGSDEAGIIPAGIGPCFCSGEREDHAFVFDDLSGVLPATAQARRSIAAYHDLRADFVVAEINYGGEWIKATINEIDPTVNVDVVHVTKGKAVRAEPVAALYGKLEDDGTVTGCKVHHVGTLAGLENEMCTLDPREPPKVSPGRLDALVFVLSKLLLGAPDGVEGIHSSGGRRWDPRRDRGRMMT
jgi:hypothetical protein